MTQRYRCVLLQSALVPDYLLFVTTGLHSA